jgi:hypothetical protein
LSNGNLAQHSRFPSSRFHDIMSVMDETVPIHQHIESIMRAEFRRIDDLRKTDLEALSIARIEMNAWKEQHNGLQRQIEQNRQQYVSRPEHDALMDRCSRIERLVYVGLGISIAIQFVVGFVLRVNK